MYRKLFISNLENWINMKKILVFIIMLILCCSCGPEKSKQQRERERYESISHTCQDNCDLFEITLPDKNGEMRSHQFIIVNITDYRNGIAHWPDCKYCKERGL